MASKFLIIDGNSLLFRAYHALPPLSSSTGQPTGALLGFTEMLLNLLEQEKPDFAAIVFDAPGPTFRHERYKEYKANRPPMPDDLVQQIELAHDISRALGLHLFEVPGVEADDVIATLARQARRQGVEVLVVSGDRDLVQIVDSGIKLLATVRGFTDTRLYDEKRVEEEFGVPPERIAELKGLAGDSSDNIPGAPGVGPKTAQRLLQQFNSIDNLFSHIDQIDSKRLAEALKKSEDLVRLGVELARVVDNVKLPIGPEDCKWPGLKVPELRRLMVELEFNKLLPKLPETDELGEVKVCIPSQQGELNSFVEKLGKVAAMDVVAVKDQPAGVALAGADEALYIPLTTGEASLFETSSPPALQEELRQVLEDEDVGKLGWDLKTQMTLLDKAGISMRGLAFDVALAAYLIAPQRGRQDLDALAARYLGAQPPPVEAGDPRAAAEPMGRRAAIIWRLREPLQRELDAAGASWLFSEVEMPLVAVLRDMERVGIAVDTKRLQQLGKQLDGFTADIARRVYEIAGHQFNIDSPKQLGNVLFEELKLPGGRKTKTGYSTSASVLSTLAQEHEIARLVLEYREYAKLRSTYVDGLLRLADERGRVHTTFEQMVTSTGRLSSRNPNLQNIPIRTEWGREIRACFIAPPGWVLVSADYSQIELRILAHLSQDPELLDAFSRGEDVHRRTAAVIFDVSPDKVDEDMRRIAKTVNYALIYGQGPVALAQQIGTTRAEAERFIESYFRRLPKVKEYLERTIQQAREKLYVQTIFGRRRPLPEIRSSEARIRAYAERAATNAPIQGSAADIIKIAMVRLAERIRADKLPANLLLQVHDELVLEVAEEAADELAGVVKEVMEGAGQLSVPLTVDVKVGPNWRDMQEP